MFLSTGNDSPVSTDSSHSRPVTATRRMSAGTISLSCIAITSPGTSAATSTEVGFPSRMTTAWWLICECSASAAFSARYSLTKPNPTDKATIVPMMTASLRSPTK